MAETSQVRNPPGGSGGDEPIRRSRLIPAEFSEVMIPSMHLARSSRLLRRFASVLLGGLLLTVALMLFAPWQQTVTGSGYVAAYAPRERQQVLEATIKGRVVRWNEGLLENSLVSKGTFIAEIRDLDEHLTERLQGQLRNTEDAWKASIDQMKNQEQYLTALRSVVESNRSQLKAYVRVRQEVEAAQDAYVEMAESKLQAEMQELIVSEAAIPQLEAAAERARLLYRDENISLEKLQEIERKLAEASGKVAKAEAYVKAAQAELRGKQRDREAYLQKADSEVQYATAVLDKSLGDVSKEQSNLAKYVQESNKAEKEFREMQIKVARQDSQVIEAPFDGVIVAISANSGSQMVKEGDPICTIVPDTKERAVQIWLRGMDAPLVGKGRHVRLQFEGWPAIQFTGWPSVAVGTFGGEVVSVDATDDGKGNFRIQVRPDPETSDWPEDRFLRQGVRANGWVLLDQVPLWFEVWRNLNGFPPTVDLRETSKPGGKPESAKSAGTKGS